MAKRHPKIIRRRILLFLYERYMADPLEMLGPDAFLREQGYTRQELIPNMHYLSDRGLVELLMGYAPPLFAGVRINANGIDLIENRYEFNLRFPPELSHEEEVLGEMPLLIEELLQEAELVPLDREMRASLARDIGYLREELARPIERWRREVFAQVVEWLGAYAVKGPETLPTLPLLQRAISELPPHLERSEPE